MIKTLGSIKNTQTTPHLYRKFPGPSKLLLLSKPNSILNEEALPCCDNAPVNRITNCKEIEILL